MNPQQPVNRFRDSGPRIPRPKVNQPSPQPETRRSRRSNQQDSSRWGQTRQFIRERPFLERAYWFCLKAFLWIFFGSLGYVISLKYVPVVVTPLMVSRWMEGDSTTHSSHIYKKWRSYDEISKEAALAVVSSEDQAFPTHWGFDFDEIQDAIKENKTRKRPRGASTISQQVAKNVFLWNGRSYIRKGLEVYFTVLIELIWGKKRILEVYLNVAETGPMTFGVEAASERFYHHAAASLSRDEAARIAAVLPNPRKFSIAHPSNYVQRRTRQIARQMRYLGGQKYIRNL
ncbi:MULTISPECIES: monofunctional biosynthetic peptidoglycan transglycosylase [unclassified Spirosoma]|uniref:monofunctional biosynthetic peptidoglycan transglycosylase n=1 Tax=unclassified Spirosoma TaxID=2621999 RepID=UPI001AD03BE2|nr:MULTISPECIES: monofunctional biosynthetic peptidoglycan transglycosylase [unclassified Spirosoma]MBN8825579.1 monofunctional biosynthetic peptidoglycan transglycosylase [Spirosoma sp.]